MPETYGKTITYENCAGNTIVSIDNHKSELEKFEIIQLISGVNKDYSFLQKHLTDELVDAIYYIYIRR